MRTTSDTKCPNEPMKSIFLRVVVGFPLQSKLVRLFPPCISRFPMPLFIISKLVLVVKITELLLI